MYLCVRVRVYVCVWGKRSWEKSKERVKRKENEKRKERVKKE